jgi:type IV pilus assembly protein PilC
MLHSWTSKNAAAATIAAGAPSRADGRRRPAPVGRVKMRQRDLAFLLSNLATLISSGVSLPKALGTVEREQSLQKQAAMIQSIRRRIEDGDSFSAALAAYPAVFSVVLVSQIKVGERAGTLHETLTQLAEQQERQTELRAYIVKKLAYPIALVILGSIIVTFMLLYVLPVFEKTYASAGVPLPFITRFMLGVGHFAASYGWLAPLGAGAGVFALKRVRAKPEAAAALDQMILKAPVIGGWLKKIAVLNLMDVLGNLLDAGYTIAEALAVARDAVTNRFVMEKVSALQVAVQRGEKFSRELERHDDLFPPVVSQLAVVGEQTGKLARSTASIRKHLRRDIERTTSILVGLLEPALTIILAAVIGAILLAIYLPMFDMIGTVAK